MYKCESCGKIVPNPYYRFTDWDNESNDVLGDFKICQQAYKNAIKQEPQGRFSIYDVTTCPHCDYEMDEGIEFNKQCPEYE